MTYWSHLYTQISANVCTRETARAKCMMVFSLYIHVSVCACVQANKRAEQCDMVPCVSVNNPTLVIGIEY